MGNFNTQHVRVRTAMVNSPDRHERSRRRSQPPATNLSQPQAVPAGRHFKRPEASVVATRSRPEDMAEPVAGVPTCTLQYDCEGSGEWGSETSSNFPYELAKEMNAGNMHGCEPAIVSSSVTWNGYAGKSQSHPDAGVYMAAKNAHEIAHYAHRVHELIAMGVKLPEWCSQYLSVARAAMGSVYHYLGYPQPIAGGSRREMAWRNAREIESAAKLVQLQLFDRGAPVPGWVDDLLAKIRYYVGTVGHFLSIEPPATGGFAGARACKRCKAHWTPPTNRERRYGNGYRP